MAAPLGNRFWEARSSHGRKPIFEAPEILWEACIEYFEWVESHPLEEEQLFHYQGTIVKGNANKMRAMTKEGLCIFLDIGMSTWDDYCAREDFSGVTTRVMEIIRDQKFAGAAAGFLNPNIIARDLGLKEQTDNQHSGRISFSELSDEDLVRRIELLESAAKA